MERTRFNDMLGGNVIAKVEHTKEEQKEIEIKSKSIFEQYKTTKAQ